MSLVLKLTFRIFYFLYFSGLATRQHVFLVFIQVAVVSDAWKFKTYSWSSLASKKLSQTLFISYFPLL